MQNSMNQMNTISKDWLSQPRLVCGIMSGTSLDGIDVALVRISLNGERYRIDPIAFDTFPMPEEARQLIKRAALDSARTSEISYLNFAIPRMYAEATKQLCASSGTPPEAIEAIGMHGQTVWHEPSATVDTARWQASTLQLGSPAVLAALLGVPVVGDFRSADVALGGQGAPLVPIFDYEMLRETDSDVVALNIGGIANITYMPASCQKEAVRAFDTGPGNMLIDYAMEHFYGLKYDASGETAAKGTVAEAMLQELMQIPFISARPPKSTGRELFSRDMFDRLVKNYKGLKHEDFVATLAEFAARSVVANIELFAGKRSKLIVSGGGAKNEYIMRRLKELLPMGNVLQSSEAGIDIDAKEAIAFAFLAYLRLAGIPANMPSVTGADREALLGGVFMP